MPLAAQRGILVGRRLLRGRPGAARYVDGVRETNHRSTTAYLGACLPASRPWRNENSWSLRTRRGSTWCSRLRRIEGVSRSEFAAKSGYTIEELIAGPQAKFVALGLLESNGDRLRLTREGLFVSDAIWPELL